MKNKKKNKNLSDSVDAIESMADAFEQINYMLNNNIPFEIVVEEESEDEEVTEETTSTETPSFDSMENVETEESSEDEEESLELSLSSIFLQYSEAKSLHSFNVLSNAKKPNSKIFCKPAASAFILSL